MEVETRNFYERASARAQDVHIRQLVDDLAQEERSHEDRAEALETNYARMSSTAKTKQTAACSSCKLSNPG